MSTPQLPVAPILGQALPIELMNTVWADRQGVHDSLLAIDDARRWVGAVAEQTQLPVLRDATGLGEDALARLRCLRDGLRRIAAERTRDPREPAESPVPDLDAAVRIINESVRAAQVWPSLEVSADGVVMEKTVTSGSLDELLIRTFAAEGIALFAPWDELDLRACLAPGCVLYFIKDHPRREWCSTACGNRARAARHYARHGRGRATGT